MSITSKKYGEIDGKEVRAYFLSNGKGLSAEILNYGGIITRLIYNDVDVALGWDNLSEYINNIGYYGAMVGRNSNRIENAEFELDGKIYKLFANSSKNNLHGGPGGFSKQIWDVECMEKDEPAVILRRVSPDGEEGFPGNAAIKVTYIDTDGNCAALTELIATTSNGQKCMYTGDVIYNKIKCSEHKRELVPMVPYEAH